jgi:hypothetical protein
MEHIAWGEMTSSYVVVNRNLKRCDHLRDLDIDGIVVVKWLLRKWEPEYVACIHLSQDWDQLEALGKSVMNSRVP